MYQNLSYQQTRRAAESSISKRRGNIETFVNDDFACFGPGPNNWGLVVPVLNRPVQKNLKS